MSALRAKAAEAQTSPTLAMGPFGTLCLLQRALPAAIEVRGQSISLRLAAPRVEGHNFDSSSCCRSPIHVLARSASTFLPWSALPRPFSTSASPYHDHPLPRPR